eukprot:81811_1
MSGLQPLIRLRLLASQLKQHELQHLIQSTIESYTADQILSLIFNHFVLKYQQTREHDNDVFPMIQMISSVLNTRKKNTKSNVKRAVSTEIKIDSIPSDMIGECASFLQVSDYVSFSKCNRKTYIGCNSPTTLQEFNLTNEFIGCDLNRFPLLKKLKLSAEALRANNELHPKQNTLNHIHSLTLYNEIDFNNPQHHALDTTSLSKCIHVPNIRHLSCVNFGFNHARWLYDSESFYDLLCSFNEVQSLTLHKVFLTDNFDMKFISIPNLRTLSVEGTNEPVLLLRNKLLDIYAQQMVSIVYDGATMDLGVSCFPKLKAVMSANPNMDSLFKIVDNAPDLEHFTCGLRMGGEFDENKLKNIIDTLFSKCVHLREVGLNANHVQIQRIAKWMENVLCDASNKITEHIRLLFVVQSHSNTQEIDDIMVCLSKLIAALESIMDDFMVTICFSSQNGPKPFEQNMDAYKDRYLVCIYDDFRSMVISNKTCKINGYLPKHIL